MMIRFNLRVLMAKHDINMVELSKATGISRQAISKMVNNQLKLIDLDILNKLCEFFKCLPGDILEYVPMPDNKVYA